MEIKKFCTVFIILQFLTCWNNANAQEDLFGAGVELTVPTGDFAELTNEGIGFSARREYVLTEKLSFSIHSGINIHAIDEEYRDTLETYVQFPLQIGGSFFPDSVGYGFFLGAKTGLHLTYFSTKNSNSSAGIFSWLEGSSTHWSGSAEIGYSLDGSFALSFRYQLLSSAIAESSIFVNTSQSFLALTGIFYL